MSGTPPLVLAAVVTPFTEQGRLDVDAARKAYAWGFAQGLDGLMLYGNMGEGPLLTGAMRDELALVADELAAPGKRILFCLQAPSENAILEQMDRLARHKHTAWSLPFPGGMGRPADPVAFFDRIASRSDRPVFFYNNPGACGVTLSLAQWRDLLAHPKLAGVKNSAGQMRARKELQRMRDERGFLLLEGDEWAVDEALALGHDGMLVGLGLLGARLFPALAAAAGRGDRVAARNIQMDAIGVFHAVYGEDVRFWCAGQKYALVRMGLFRSSVTLMDDQRSLPDANRRAIDELVDRHADWFPKA